MEYGNKAVDVKEFRNINAGREVFYNFLARSYKTEVNGEYLEMLISLMPYIEDIAFQSDIEKLKKGGKLLREFANKLTGLNSEDKKELLLDLARDFTYLFITGLRSVPTSESVYLSPEHLVKQEQRDSVLKLYKETGLSVSKDFREPEDHIALEFEFMARLSHLICKSIDTEDNKNIRKYINCQKEFMEKSLNKWIPQFCSFLIKAVEERTFYRALGYITEGFLTMDYRFMKEVCSGNFFKF